MDKCKWPSYHAGRDTLTHGRMPDKYDPYTVTHDRMCKGRFIEVFIDLDLVRNEDELNGDL